jgi:hypothetical protein
MRLLAILGAALVRPLLASPPSQWEKPAFELAEQIAGILGPGQARLTVRNLSNVPVDDIPAIRQVLEQDLKARGVLASGAESAITIRVTLSENVRVRLWVAEIAEGSETHVAMVELPPGNAPTPQAANGMTLRKQTVSTTKDAVLATLEIANSLVVLEPEEIVIYSDAGAGWAERKRVGIGKKRPLPRDPRGVMVASSSGQGFEAYVAGTACSGSYAPEQPEGEWSVRCHESDDPWPLGAVNFSGAAPLRAFYSAALDYFTGVVTPSIGADSPPFYAAALVPRSSGAGLLLNGIDGKVEIAESGILKTVSGARDWGSDFAALQSGCGAGTQIVVSSSGEAAMDSLRAYELPAQEAIPASAPMPVEGTVMALWSAPDGKSVLAVVRGPAGDFEVDRVTVLCDE